MLCPGPVSQVAVDLFLREADRMFPEGVGAPRAMAKEGEAAEKTNELLVNAKDAIDKLWKQRGYATRVRVATCAVGAAECCRCCCIAARASRPDRPRHIRVVCRVAAGPSALAAPPLRANAASCGGRVTALTARPQRPPRARASGRRGPCRLQQLRRRAWAACGALLAAAAAARPPRARHVRASRALRSHHVDLTY